MIRNLKKEDKRFYKMIIKLEFEHKKVGGKDMSNFYLK
jgi:hypothetical protein